jgi:hypothetical protein
MMDTKNIRCLCCAALIAALAGCASKGDAPSENNSTTAAPAAKAQVSSAGKTQPAASAKVQSSSSSSSTAGGVPPGMNARGEVVDSSKVEAGHGTKLKVGEWEGEITGKPAPKTRFTKLTIGMTMSQVTHAIGEPSDRGVYVTGKAFIPFYFGSDRHRYELVYKGSGRLIFAADSIGDWNTGHLIWIIHNANEPATR